MQWRGKMIGGSIGSFFGPWGALAGAAVGHAFVDRKQAAAAEKEALSLLAVTAGSLYEVAGVDGRYTPAEDKTIRAILAELNERLGSRLSAHELTYLIDDSSRIDRSLARLAARARTQPDLRMAATAWLWRTAVCDGDPTPPETSCVHAFIGQTGLPPEEAERAAILYVRPHLHADERERQQACGVLGVAYHADQSQIKAAYRTLSQTYHPDKHAGLDPAIRALTAEKFAQIKTAYDTLCGTSCRIQGWVVKPVGANRLIPATAGAAVHCFICGRKHELPAEAQIGAARCASCQTLLALDPGLAEQLI